MASRDPVWRSQHAGEIITGPDLIRDRKLAVRTALHMIRYSFNRTGHLGLFSGERGNGPKAQKRVEQARKWVVEHPIDIVTSS